MVCLLCRRVWEQPPLSTVSGCRRAVGAPRVTRAMPGGPAEVGRRPGPAHDGREIPGLGFGQVGCCADLGRGGGITQRLLVPGFRCLARFAC